MEKNNVENAVATTTTATRYEKDIDDDADGNTLLSMGHIVKWIYKKFFFFRNRWVWRCSTLMGKQ